MDMQLIGVKVERLTIHIFESDRWEDGTLYEAIVHAAGKHGLAGATVYRGIMGYGSDSRIHTTTMPALSQDLPIVVEIIDDVETIKTFLPQLDDMVAKGLVLLEPAKVVISRSAADGD